jgi:hypothetical protein
VIGAGFQQEICQAMGIFFQPLLIKIGTRQPQKLIFGSTCCSPAPARP